MPSPRRTRRIQARIRYRESAERLRTLVDTPYRIARRTDNTPVTLGALGTDLSRLRNGIASMSSWLEAHNRPMADSFERLVAAVDADIKPRLDKAWEVQLGVAASDANRFRPSPQIRYAIARWARLATFRPPYGQLTAPLITRWLLRGLTAADTDGAGPTTDDARTSGSE